MEGEDNGVMIADAQFAAAMAVSSRTVISVANPRWGDAAQTLLDVDVVFLELGPEPVPFTTAAHADTDYGLAIWEAGINGDYGPIVEYAPPPTPPIVVALGDFWSRLTDEDAEEFDGAMMAKPIRLRRLYQAEQTAYSEGTELFDAVSATLVDLFGQARRNALLAA